ncbi:hypothetical protein C4K04_4776 [Pseudomonas chlororaphis]|uniref:Integrase n=1 Tax=Pseudomonas chlororaphis TaxID=587753 RepID=A0A3G7TU47_9PSED|nr:site-specific integrase [Pseudomonas chlororaphis]AZE50431.1 hypothetical protein C4K04_4776 [Pseudomonas chlororaphis]
MSLRTHNKDHLQNYTGDYAVAPLKLDLPAPEDPLQFWIQHPTQNLLIDLTAFAEGQTVVPRTGRWGGPFSGRPQLIRQLAPAIKVATIGLSPVSAKNSMRILRTWWRLLDGVENAAGLAGQLVVRVEDVRQLTRLHCEYAHQTKMHDDSFTWFLGIANVILRAHGSPTLHWDTPKNPQPKRHLPPEDQIAVLRVALKQTWESVRKRWALSDRVRTEGFIPQSVEEEDLLKHWEYFSEKQHLYGIALPTADQLRGGLPEKRFARFSGLTLVALRATAFPTLWEADTAFHMCLANSGWNPAVLFALDGRFEELFLRDHPQDKDRYILVGTKARAGGKEQIVDGLWKTPWGPGPIVRTWLERVKPLREQLQTRLVFEKERFNQMRQDGASSDVLSRQHNAVLHLEKGCRSVWLYAGRGGRIEWLREEKCNVHHLNGKVVSYLFALIHLINVERAERGEAPISLVTASDFRDIFALYVWRQSGGNILAVMRLLNHSQLRTTQGYVDNNILNAERDQQTRTFLDHLFAELGQGRLDITILAHLQRHGAVTPEMEKRLQDFRTMERSRLGVACQDPFNPPPAIQPDTDGSRRCGAQRCLLCRQNALILPESLAGIAMRVEELMAIQKSVSVESWLTSDFPKELSNGLDALALFPVDNVHEARVHWAEKIVSGAHRVPGLRLATIQSEDL